MTPDASASSDYDHLHLLLVDDDGLLLDIMQDALHGLGVGSIQLANTGLEGLHVYKHSNPPINAIICDLCMPELGGMEFLGHLARAGCKAEVVIMSGHNRTPPPYSNWTLGNYNGPVLNLAEKMARIQGITVRASFEKLFSVSIRPVGPTFVEAHQAV
ncbi:MAG: response regulator [Undibacterium sp.]|nr:response regulator [Undibacterium sp.]